MSSKLYHFLFVSTLVLLLGIRGAAAGEVRLAVAANFAAPADAIAQAFTEATGDQVIISIGSTGALFAQISQGAPYDILLAADSARATRAVDENLAVEGSQFTYAVGRLALYVPQMDDGDGEAWLGAVGSARVAIADPQTAPYGAAALETLDSLDLTDMLDDRLVYGQSVAQAHQFVVSGNAEAGFVALSEVREAPPGSVWVVPESLHQPIRQDAVLLTGAGDVATAEAFLDYLKGTAAAAIIADFGYGPGDE